MKQMLARQRKNNINNKNANSTTALQIYAANIYSQQVQHQCSPAANPATGGPDRQQL